METQLALRFTGAFLLCILFFLFESMPRHEQKLTYHSPLSELSKPRAMKQAVLLPQAVPHPTSPFSLPRLAYMLRRPVETMQSFRDRVGRRWHTLKTEQKEAGFSSSLSFAAADGEVEASTVQTIRGKTIKLTQEGATAVFTNEHGATIRYSATGQGLGSPTPLRRAVETTGAEIPWYQETAEAVGRAGIRLENIQAEIIEAPAAPGITRNNTPVARFKLRILGTAEPVELPADAYNDTSRERGGNPYRIQQTINKHLQAGDTVVFTGHYHHDKTTFQNETGAKPYERKWIRLLVIDRKSTG